LNIAQCNIRDEGTRGVLLDLRFNKKLTSLTLDFNEFDEETLQTVFVDGLSENKCLTTLSLANCELKDEHIPYISEALSHNTHLLTLNLSSNKLSSVGMLKLKDKFGDGRKSMSIRHLDVSSNLIDDQGGVYLIQALHTQDIETLNLKNNMVKDLTAAAVCHYVETKGVRLKKIDLTMNQAISQKLLDDIEFQICRNI
jgi:Ran GTPase-activating protein (RanGAP) involved in mRNA processing and transport